jgi:ABC-2 type transport system permease protein
LNPIIGIAVKDTRTFFRERGIIFWTMAFPIMIMLLFTAIFGRNIPFSANIGIVDNDHTSTTAAITAILNSSSGPFTVIAYTNSDDAFAALNATTVRAVIIIPAGFTTSLAFKNATVPITVDKSNPDVANIVTNGITTAFSEFYKNPPYNYTDPVTFTVTSAIPGQTIGYKENIIPGMLTYPLLFSSMVVSTGAIVFEREKGTLKKIRASPIPPLHMLVGKALAALFQTTISIFVMSILAYFLLSPHLNWSISLLVPILFLGSLNGIALGLIISCVGRAPQEASNAATTVAIVLQFFTGMYFPFDYLPSYMQQIARVIPMTYAAQALRDVMIRNATLDNVALPLGTLAGAALLLFAIGVLLYNRWVQSERD